MNRNNGISAPTTVSEGTNAPISVEAPGATTLEVLVAGTGEQFVIQLDACGRGSFSLPSTALAGEEITMIDPDDPSVCAQISVVPASGAARTS